ncbi:RlmE family RNA methyltransferase [Thalassobaculum fulvum]|uniref:RlmE family RNA methyltransferase n=1 Tax=Thalassobaculum fulvum TaxID=1633335 RepID=UPI001674F53B|nr:RlmE family RNA methyltransferase [Thalassobaculum fulvum]
MTGARGSGRRPGARGRAASGHAAGGGTGGSRQATVRVKTARGRTASSQRWLERQLNDPYVAESKRLGYRSRAAFKLLQLDDKYHFLKPGARVVDLGAAPGGWTQIAVTRVGAPDKGQVVGLDYLPVEPIAGATLIEADFMAEDAPARLKAALGGPVDVVLSDMAAPTTGHSKTDHLRIVGLCEAALEFAIEVLAPGGAFVAKVFQGGTEGELLARMKRAFRTVRHAKPPASRAESAETYVVATGFRGEPEGG